MPNICSSLCVLFQKQNKDGSESIARAYTLCSERAKGDAMQMASRDAQFVSDHIRVHPFVRMDNLEKQRSVRPSLLRRDLGKSKCFAALSAARTVLRLMNLSFFHT